MDIKSIFISIEPKIPGALYKPLDKNEKNHIGVLVMHSDENYLSFSAGQELSKRGYTVICVNVSDRNNSLNTKLLEASFAVHYLRQYEGIEKVLLFGHSGGATLMSAYQNIAENGPEIFQGKEKLIKCPNELNGFEPADGLLLIDSNWGNGAMRLFSLNPAIISEDNGTQIDPSLDLFNPENGFSPDGSTYDKAFIRRFQKMQGKRNNRLISHALERLDKIEAGKGRYKDDEPFVVPDAAQGFMNNKLYAQDIRLMSHTRKEQNLLHLNGILTKEVVHSLRKSENSEPLANSLGEGALITTVKKFLDSYAIRTTDEYGYDESSVYGVDWSSSYNCTTGNVKGIHSPILIMGMTGGWEFACAETIYDNATSENKTLTYVEGANHLFKLAENLEAKREQFGDTMKTTYDYIDDWIEKSYK